MKNKKIKYGLLLCFALVTIIGFWASFGYWYYYKALPDNIHVSGIENNSVEFDWPLTGEIISNNVRGKNTEQLQNNSYVLDIKYLGLFHVKNISVNVMEKGQLIPCGFPLGIYLEMDGLLVVDITEFKNNRGATVCPCENILQKGDYITDFNGEKINSKEEFTDRLEKSSGEIILKIRRNNSCFDVKIKPEKDSNNVNHIGAWIKDDAQGIGTLTFIDDKGNYGALGHGMNDTDCGELIQTQNGKIYNAQIMSITKGLKGEPGEFVGTIDYNSGNVIGTINRNTNLGIYGKMNDKLSASINNNVYCKPVNVAFKEDIQLGAAQIQTYCDGKIRRYDIIIEKVDVNEDGNKGIKFQVIDENLLERTNGIVQGMSGSPILQNGRIIGAVTHVFVNDPARGYGIFIENMLSFNAT